MAKLLKTFQKTLNSWYSKPHVAAILAIVFILYASLVAPELPPFWANLFGNPVFKVLFMSAILLLRKFDPVLALLVSIGFVLSLQTFHRYESFAMLKEWRQKLFGKKNKTVEEQNVVSEQVQSDTQVTGLNTDDFMGAQGLDEPSGFSGRIIGSPYGGPDDKN